MSREERLTKNEALFREVNQRIEEIHEPVTTFDVVCECGDAACKETLGISPDKYGEVRTQPTHFLVIPGHEILDVETVIESTARFNVVEKDMGEEEIARLADRS